MDPLHFCETNSTAEVSTGRLSSPRARGTRVPGGGKYNTYLLTYLLPVAGEGVSLDAPGSDRHEGARMEAGGSRAALKRARKKQNKARPPQPERRDPPPAAASSDQLVGKKRDKRKDKRAAKRKLQEVEAADDEPDELEGVVADGELLLRDPSSGAVYASERDERGALVTVGRWEAP